MREVRYVAAVVVAGSSRRNPKNTKTGCYMYTYAACRQGKYCCYGGGQLARYTVEPAALHG